MPTEKARQFQRQMEEKRRKEGKVPEKGVIEKVWLGGESEDWKEKRLREEQEAIDRGEGYGSLIMGQINEVWNWRKPKGEKEEGESETKE
jgi:hypothetical protein